MLSIDNKSEPKKWYHNINLLGLYGIYKIEGMQHMIMHVTIHNMLKNNDITT